MPIYAVLLQRVEEGCQPVVEFLEYSVEFLEYSCVHSATWTFHRVTYHSWYTNMGTATRTGMRQEDYCEYSQYSILTHLTLDTIDFRTYVHRVLVCPVHAPITAHIFGDIPYIPQLIYFDLNWLVLALQQVRYWGRRCCWGTPLARRLVLLAYPSPTPPSTLPWRPVAAKRGPPLELLGRPRSPRSLPRTLYFVFIKKKTVISSPPTPVCILLLSRAAYQNVALRVNVPLSYSELTSIKFDRVKGPQKLGAIHGSVVPLDLSCVFAAPKKPTRTRACYRKGKHLLLQSSVYFQTATEANVFLPPPPPPVNPAPFPPPQLRQSNFGDDGRRSRSRVGLRSNISHSLKWLHSCWSETRPACIVACTPVLPTKDQLVRLCARSEILVANNKIQVRSNLYNTIHDTGNYSNFTVVKVYFIGEQRNLIRPRLAILVYSAKLFLFDLAARLQELPTGDQKIRVKDASRFKTLALSAESQSGKFTQSNVLECCSVWHLFPGRYIAWTIDLERIYNSPSVSQPSDLQTNFVRPSCMRRDHCAPVESLAFRGDGALDARVNVALIAPAILGLKTREYGAVSECNVGENGRYPRKPADQRHRPARFPRTKIRGRQTPPPPPESNSVRLMVKAVPDKRFHAFRPQDVQNSFNQGGHLNTLPHRPWFELQTIRSAANFPRTRVVQLDLRSWKSEVSQHFFFRSGSLGLEKRGSCIYDKRRVFPGFSRFPRRFIPVLLHTSLASPSSAPKISLVKRQLELRYTRRNYIIIYETKQAKKKNGFVKALHIIIYVSDKGCSQ
ncbi:hypothetical protein PR048_033188 [Dryococelus australis]|uniref:Uncharacterized protein n=1 Tax=Dryococelus australis TaxID=614101 RepID=A0ABQ9G0I2_9NEOP|nr:hypothetical protein PR048_033188 [Dryococelus australis]